MISFTTLSFNSLNIYIDTGNLVGGFNFVTSCVSTDNVINEVVINGLTMDGIWKQYFTYGGLYMTGT